MYANAFLYELALKAMVVSSRVFKNDQEGLSLVVYLRVNRMNLLSPNNLHFHSSAAARGMNERRFNKPEG